MKSFSLIAYIAQFKFQTVFIICCLLPSGGLAATEINLTQSRLLNLAQQLESADSGKKYDFLTIALQQMYRVYSIEAEKAASETPSTAKKRAKVFRWQHSSYHYLDSIEGAMIQLDIQDIPDFFISKQHKIIVLLDNQPPVIISGPNNGANKTMEQNIVTEFCLLYDCSDYFNDTEKATADNTSHTNNTNTDTAGISTELGGSWSIKKDLKGAYVTDTGLTFNFNTLKNRVAKEQWMADVYQELSLILSDLKQALQHGHAINWSEIRLEPLPVTDKASRLIINSDQKYLKLNVPVLTNNPDLFKQLIPWLKYRFIKKQNLPTIIRYSDRYFKSLF